MECRLWSAHDVREVAYLAVTDVDSAIAALSAHENAMLLAGGTNVVDYLRAGAISPSVLIDISAVPLTDVHAGEAGFEVYDVDDGGFQVYDAQARYLPSTWQAPDPRRRWAGQARLGPPQQGQEGRLCDALRRFLPLIGRADLAEAPVLDLQAAAQAISDHYGGPSSVQDGDGPGKGAQVPLLLRALNSYVDTYCNSPASP
jgi:FAD binding domain in molybdopterin dehydrogenase